MIEMFPSIALIAGGIIGPSVLPSTMPHINAVGLGALVGFLCFLGVYLIWLTFVALTDNASTDYYGGSERNER
jgi:hypothetical protein